MRALFPLLFSELGNIYAHGLESGVGQVFDACPAATTTIEDSDLLSI